MNLLDLRTSEHLWHARISGTHASLARTHLWHARIDEPLEFEPAALADQIIRAVAALFEELPK